MAREALTNARGFGRYAAASCVIAIALSLAPVAAHAAHYMRPRLPDAPVRHLPYPRLASPLEISGSQYAPVGWADIPGWSEDDQLQAYKAFRVSCKPISAQRGPPADAKALGTSLRDPCRAARATDISDGARARAFFQAHFLPLRISRIGEDDGFVTGYYEPVIDGSRTQTATRIWAIRSLSAIQSHGSCQPRMRRDCALRFPQIGRRLRPGRADAPIGQKVDSSHRRTRSVFAVPVIVPVSWTGTSGCAPVRVERRI